jgi:hypothetical protein
MTSKLIQETAQLLQKDFDLSTLPPQVTKEAMLDFLERLVEDLLNSKLDRLFFYLYRLDIDELKVKEALSFEAVDLPHQQIALLIFNREVQKAKTRIKFKQQYNSEDGDGWE